MRALAQTALAVAALAVATGCGGQATVKLKMENVTPAAPAGRLASAPVAGDAAWAVPTQLSIKLVAVYLAEDVDPVTQNNIGNTAMIYLNPQCGGDINDCGVAPGFSRHITVPFDFAQGTAAVNAALNAQGNEIDPGTYRYARMEFCRYGVGDEPNLWWQTSAMSAPASGFYNTCGITSRPFETPITLKDGDSASVTLSYDLSEAAMIGTAGGPDLTMVDAAGAQHFFMNCVDDGGVRSCLQVPEFVPSAQHGP